jgi:hypothetical protein
MRILHDRLDGDGELLATVIALIDPRPVSFSFKLVDMVYRTAMRAYRAFRPPDALYRGACLILRKL